MNLLTQGQGNGDSVKEDKIRARLSYSFWFSIAKSCRNPSVANNVCHEVYKRMDDRMMFNTEQQSRWDKESMDLALEDFSQKRT